MPAPDDDTHSHPRTLPMEHAQPSPLSYALTYLEFPGHVGSGLLRVWTIGDTRRCRLCDVCTAVHDRGVCVVHVDHMIPDDPRSALLFSTRGLAPAPSAYPPLAEDLAPGRCGGGGRGGG